MIEIDGIMFPVTEEELKAAARKVIESKKVLVQYRPKDYSPKTTRINGRPYSKELADYVHSATGQKSEK